jgi:hypothetical protein
VQFPAKCTELLKLHTRPLSSAKRALRVGSGTAISGRMRGSRHETPRSGPGAARSQSSNTGWLLTGT